jgi:hypothetical protein
MCGESSNLVAELLGGNDGNFLNDALVGLEIAGQTSVVLLDNQLRGLLNGLGAYTTLESKKKIKKVNIMQAKKKQRSIRRYSIHNESKIRGKLNSIDCTMFDPKANAKRTNFRAEANFSP